MPSETPRIGLALSGGAARGMAHAGVLRALVENDIPIDCIAGTSAGSIVGGAYAAGLSVDQLADLARAMRWRHVGWPTISHLGLQSNARLERFMRKHLPVTRFEDLRIPFAAVATDLKTGEAVVMRDEGDLPFAIRASCTIPGVYVPVKDKNGRLLVDGGLAAVVPVTMARELGADIVIAVDVNSDGSTLFGARRTVVGVLFQSVLMVLKTASLYQRELADLVITPKIAHIRWDQIRRAEELMEAGYQAGLESIPGIQKLISASQSKSYQLTGD